MQLIHAYRTQALINGLTRSVVVSIETDGDDFDRTYMDESLVAEVEAKIEQGSMDVVWIKVTARFTDLAHFEGIDTLGQVFVSKRDDVLSTVTDHDMAQNAIDELVAHTLQGVESIQAFLKGA